MAENINLLTGTMDGPDGDRDEQSDSQPTEMSLAAACLSIALSFLAMTFKKVFKWSIKSMVVVGVLLALYFHNTIIDATGFSQAWQKFKIPMTTWIKRSQATVSDSVRELVKGKPAATPYQRETIENEIRKWSIHYNIHPDLAFAVAQTESGMLPYQTRFEPEYYECHVLGIGNQCRKSAIPDCWQGSTTDRIGRKMLATSWGLYQIMPLTAAETADREGFLNEIDAIPKLLEIDLNIRIGLAHLRHCIDIHDGNFNLVAQCYNGPKTKGWNEAVKKALFARILEQSSKGDLK